MKNKIESRHVSYSRKRSSSGSSSEMKSDTKYKDSKKLRHKHSIKKHFFEKEDYKRKGNHSSSKSSSNDSDEEEEEPSSKGYRNKEESFEKNYNSYHSVKIKDEPITDDEYNQRNSNQYHSDRTNRRYENDFRGSKRRSKSRSRSPNSYDRRPVKKERFSDGFNDKKPIKKERFTDVEKEPRWGKQGDEQTSGQKKPMVDKAKPDFGLSGKLTEETNTYNGVVIKYSEPPEARKPKRRWRLYPFKGDEGLPTLYIHRQSAFLIGRDRKIADLPVDHPSCSKQHAVLQYRLVPFHRSDGSRGKRICPYIIDLESANGTFVNNSKIEPKKYVELMEKDVIKFAFSSREYVLLHEHSKDSEDDDDM